MYFLQCCPRSTVPGQDYQAAILLIICDNHGIITGMATGEQPWLVRPRIVEVIRYLASGPVNKVG
jgi:hypothetical protein